MDKSKRQLTIGCIGHKGHGKTTLMMAIAKVQKAKGYKVERSGAWMPIYRHEDGFTYPVEL